MAAEILEALMIMSFGAAWPASILRSYRSRTTKGKSISFLLIVAFGYMCGVASKFVAERISYVVVFYMFNLIAVSVDSALYFRNLRLDRARDRGETV